MALTSEGVVTKIGYRICDWVGNTIVEPLPHLNQETWTIIGMQPGQPGSGAIGSFAIRLHAPRSTEFWQYKGTYSLINYGQRVEAYVLGEDGEYMFGNVPVWSGIITKIEKLLDKYEISGFDTIWLANQSIFAPGQVFSNLTGEAGFNQGVFALLTNYIAIENLIFIDDFGSSRYPSYATNWTSVIGSTWTNSTDDTLPGLLSPASSAESVMLTTAARSGVGSATKIFPSGIADSTTFTAWFHLFNPSNSNGASLDAGIIIGSDATNNNGWLCRATAIGNGSTYDVRAQIFVKSAGVYSTALADTSVFTGLTGDRKLQVIVIVEGGSSVSNSTIRVLVNGKDTNCVASMSGHTKEPGSNFGVRWISSGSAGMQAFVTKFYIKRRANAWASGTDYPQPIVPFVSPGGPIGGVLTDLSVNLLDLNGVNILDLWNIAASSDGIIWRKDAQRLVLHPNFTPCGDPIPVGIQGRDVGVDLSKDITLDESTNIVTGGATANADHIASEIAFGFSPNVDGDGRINWPDTPGILNLGQGPGNLAPPLIIPDIVNITALSDMLLARRMVESMGAQKALTTGQAKTFTIMRTPDLTQPRLDTFTNQLNSDFSGKKFMGLSPQAFREMDFVTLNCPSIDIFNARVSVLSYTFRGGDPTFDVVLDQQTSESKTLVDRRRWGSLDNFMLLYATRS